MGAVNDLDDVFHVDVVLLGVQGHSKAVVLLPGHGLVPDRHHLPVHIQHLGTEGVLGVRVGRGDMEQGFPKAGWSFPVGDCPQLYRTSRLPGSGAGNGRAPPSRHWVNQKCSQSLQNTLWEETPPQLSIRDLRHRQRVDVNIIANVYSSPCARPHAKFLTYKISLKPQNFPLRWMFSPYLTDGKSQAQRGRVTSPGSHSMEATELSFESRAQGPKHYVPWPPHPWGRGGGHVQDPVVEQAPNARVHI